MIVASPPAVGWLVVYVAAHGIGTDAQVPAVRAVHGGVMEDRQPRVHLAEGGAHRGPQLWRLRSQALRVRVRVNVSGMVRVRVRVRVVV